MIHGWKTALPLTAVEAVRALEPYCGEFLYTHVDAEGLMQGTNIEAILDVRGATTRRVTAAGGITTQEEIDTLDAHGVDSVVGMAVYTGKLEQLPELAADELARLRRAGSDRLVQTRCIESCLQSLAGGTLTP